VAVAANAKRLRLSDSSSAIDSEQNQYILSKYPELEKLEWKGKLSSQKWNDDSKFITLPKLRYVTIDLDAEDMKERHQRLTARILPFNTPVLERFTLNSPNMSGGAQYIEANISTFIADSSHPNSSNLISLRFTNPYVIVYFSSSNEQAKFNHLTTLQCNIETAASLAPLTPNLTTLSIIARLRTSLWLFSKQARECRNFLKCLAQSTTLVSIEFGGKGYTVKDFDVFLYEKRRVLSEQREKSDHSKYTSQPLRHLSIQGYPDWTILLNILHLLHESDPESQIKSIKLPGFPHSSILVAITDALKGRFIDTTLTTNL
jgi:hypothetical protein